MHSLGCPDRHTDSRCAQLAHTRRYRRSPCPRPQAAIRQEMRPPGAPLQPFQRASCRQCHYMAPWHGDRVEEAVPVARLWLR
eukprot:7386583-Prymnesium_polylepis.1